jgi:hypothetical protein
VQAPDIVQDLGVVTILRRLIDLLKLRFLRETEDLPLLRQALFGTKRFLARSFCHPGNLTPKYQPVQFVATNSDSGIESIIAGNVVVSYVPTARPIESRFPRSSSYALLSRALEESTKLKRLGCLSNWILKVERRFEFAIRVFQILI